MTTTCVFTLPQLALIVSKALPCTSVQHRECIENYVNFLAYFLKCCVVPIVLLLRIHCVHMYSFSFCDMLCDMAS